MESESLNPISPQTGDAESKMRRNLGLDGGTANDSPSSSSNDPLKAARQAIRSQVAAREYTERQLVQAQTAIQDLRTRLRHVHQEREAAMGAAQSAMTAKDTAERNIRAAETALATERATRVRTEGMLRDAEAMVRDLREKLATANQTIHTMRAELAAERLTRPKPDHLARLVIAAPEAVVAVAQDVIVPTVRRSVGRPRKTAVMESVQTSRGSTMQPQVMRDTAVPTVRRPVGRPRKITVAPPVEMPITVPKTARSNGTPIKGTVNQKTEDQEPIQWWVAGWKKRS